jgi:hypothetical protein
VDIADHQIVHGGGPSATAAPRQLPSALMPASRTSLPYLASSVFR